MTSFCFLHNLFEYKHFKQQKTVQFFSSAIPYSLERAFNIFSNMKSPLFMHTKYILYFAVDVL